MCDPLTAITAVAGGFQAAQSLFGGGNKAPKPAAPAPAPQASKVPDAAGVRAGEAANGGAPASGPGGGTASTFLSGAGGVDPNSLTLGRNALLGQ